MVELISTGRNEDETGKNLLTMVDICVGAAADDNAINGKAG